MTEQRWLTCEEPRKLLDHVEVHLRAARTRVGRRKLRLLASACARRAAWRLRVSEDEPSPLQVCDAAEQLADGHLAPHEAFAWASEQFREVPAFCPPERYWTFWHDLRAWDPLESTCRHASLSIL